MKDIVFITILLLPCCICFAGAVYLLSIGATQGWGWLLFVGALCSGVKYKNKGQEG